MSSNISNPSLPDDKVQGLDNMNPNSGDTATSIPTVSTTTRSYNFTKSSESSLASRSAFLTLFIVVAFVGNCVLIATIAQSKRLRKRMLNLFIMSAAAVNLLDCVVNMPLILGTTVTQDWDYGDFVCKFQACFIQTVSIARILSLTAMVFDRFIAVRTPHRYDKRITFASTNSLIGYTWIHALAFSIPLLTDSVPTTVFVHRYLCSIANKADLLYISLVSIFSFLVPLAMVIIFYIVIIKTGIQEKLRSRQMMNNPQYTDSAIDDSQVWKEVRGAIYVGILFLLWCIFEGPYLLINYVEQYQNSEQMMDSAPAVIFAFPNEVDLAFTWMKLGYAMVLPFATFFWRKEIWQKFKDLILCRKSNLIIDASPRMEKEHSSTLTRGLDKSRDIAGSNNASFNAPVLFATEHGLHIQTYVGIDEETDDTQDELSISQSFFYNADKNPSVKDLKTMNMKYKNKKCDVPTFGSRDLAGIADGDTSDYDSHADIDPFSVSNPVSMQDKGNDKVYSRENSQGTDVLVNKLKKSLAADETKTLKDKHNNAVDSGVESTNNSAEKKRKAKKKVQKEETTLQEKYEDESKTENTESGDSGRGTVNENEVKKKRPKIQTQSSDNGDSENRTKRTTSKTDLRSNSKTDLRTASKTNLRDELEQEIQPVQPNKKKKKKQPKTESNDDFNEVEMKSVDTTSLESNGKVKRPPARLKPIEHKSIKSDKSSPKTDKPVLSHPRKQSSETGSGTRSRHNSESDAKQPVEHSRSNSIDTASVNSERSRYGGAKTAKIRRSSVASSNDNLTSPTQNKASKSARHRRHISDSETNLLQTSNTSEEFQAFKSDTLGSPEEIKVRRKKSPRTESAQHLLGTN